MSENPSPFGPDEQGTEDSSTSSSDSEVLISDVQPSMTFKQAFGLWLESRQGFISDRTYRDYNASKKPLFKFFGNIPLEAITAGQIRQYQVWRLRVCGSPSINHECSILQQILKRVRVWAKIADDYQPIPIPRVGPGKALTEEEEARWFAAAAIKPGWRVAYPGISTIGEHKRRPERNSGSSVGARSSKRITTRDTDHRRHKE